MDTVTSPFGLCWQRWKLGYTLHTLTQCKEVQVMWAALKVTAIHAGAYTGQYRLLLVLPVVLVESGEALFTQLLYCAMTLRFSGNALRPLFPRPQLVVLDVVGKHALELVQM